MREVSDKQLMENIGRAYKCRAVAHPKAMLNLHPALFSCLDVTVASVYELVWEMMSTYLRCSGK